MFISLKRYLFLALIFNSAHAIDRDISLISTVDYPTDVNINYAIQGREIVPKLEFKSEIIGKALEIESMEIQ